MLVFLPVLMMRPFFSGPFLLETFFVVRQLSSWAAFFTGPAFFFSAPTNICLLGRIIGTLLAYELWQ